jgi:predicted membrane metal-binding protein
VGKFIEIIIAYPSYSYFIIQGVLLVIYVPIAIRHVHRFGWFRLLLVMVFTTFHIPVSIIFYEVNNFVSAPIG